MSVFPNSLLLNIYITVTTVILTQTAPIQTDPSTVLVTMDTLETGSTAQVCQL